MIYDVVIYGHVSFDETKTCNGQAVYSSGAAYLCAAGAINISDKVVIVTCVGIDFQSTKLFSKLYDKKGIYVFSEGKTSRFYHEYNNSFSDRIFRAELNIGYKLNPEHIPTEYFSTKFFHVATNLPSKQIEVIKKVRDNSRAVISIDTIEDYIKDYTEDVINAISLADIIFLNRRERTLISDSKMTQKHLVIKKGKEGAMVLYKDLSISRRAPLVENIVDTTGSGDVLAGAYLACQAKGMPVDISLEIAVKIASKSICCFGVDHMF